jgi:hypothetical protein
MKTALVVGMLALSITVTLAHNKDLSDTGRTPMKSRATAGIGPGANSKKTSNPTEDGLNNHLTR